MNQILHSALATHSARHVRIVSASVLLSMLCAPVAWGAGETSTAQASISLGELGMAIGFGEAIGRLDGIHTTYRYRTVELNPVDSHGHSYQDGLLALAWQHGSVRVDTIREQMLDERRTYSQEAEQFFLLSGEFASAQSLVGGGNDNAFVVCGAQPPTLSLTLVGQLGPRYREASAVISDRSTRGSASIVFEAKSKSVQLRLTDLSCPIPALWTIQDGLTVEHIGLFSPLRDEATGRWIPGAVVQGVFKDGRLTRAGVWVLVTVDAPNVLHLVLHAGASVYDGRTAANSPSQVLDRSMSLDSLPSWLGLGIVSPPGNVPLTLTKEAATQPNPSPRSIGGLGQPDLLRASEYPLPPTAQTLEQAISRDLEEPMRLLDVSVAEGSGPGPSAVFSRSALPSIGYRSLSRAIAVKEPPPQTPPPGSGLAADPPHPVPASAQASIRGARWQDVVPERRVFVVPEILYLSQLPDQMRLVGTVTLASPRGQINLLDVRTGCGLACVDRLPLSLRETPTSITFEMSIARPWPDYGRLAARLIFDDSSELSLPFMISITDPPVLFDRASIDLRGCATVELFAHSPNHAVHRIKWTRIPECVRLTTIGEDPGGYQWKIDRTGKHGLRHRCERLLGVCELEGDAHENGQDLGRTFTISMPIVHEAECRDPDGRLILGCVLRPGEHLMIASTQGGDIQLCYPDRAPFSPGILQRCGLSELITTQAPTGAGERTFEMTYGGPPGLRVVATVTSSMSRFEGEWKRTEGGF